jgi:hypothetical protein
MPITTVKRDIGRRVIYMGDRTLPPLERIGEITSLNEHYVFVRYARDTTSKATRRDDLEWCF